MKAGIGILASMISLSFLCLSSDAVSLKNTPVSANSGTTARTGVAPHSFRTDGAGVIPYWLALGPIPIPANEAKGAALDKDILGSGNGIKPTAGDKVAVNGKDYTWKFASTKDGTPTLDAGLTLGRADNAVAYLVSYVVAPSDMPDTMISWGSDDSAGIFVNGEEISRFTGGRGCNPDSNKSRGFTMKAGVNTVMIKLLNQSADWGATAKLIGPNDKPLAKFDIAINAKGDMPTGSEWTIVSTGFGPKIIVNQVGYRTSGRKVAILASPTPAPDNIRVSILDSKTGNVVWKLDDNPNALKKFGEDGKDNESGDYVSHLDFSTLSKPGSYYILTDIDGDQGKSFEIVIADNVYRDAGLATWRALYFQRSDTELPEKYAGPYAHKLDHCGPGQATEARVYRWTGNQHYQDVGKEIEDPTPHDVRGSWWDAGNFDKYIGNTMICHNWLLLGYQLVQDKAKDNDLNIPESGNGIPDLLDEIRYSTEWFIRMADETGAAWGRAHEDGACPPEKNTTTVQLTAQTSGATMNRCAALAYAALVWKELGKDQVFAKKCLDEAMKSWDLLQKKPPPWPANPKKPGKTMYTGEWFFADYDKCQTLAAACFFEITGDKKYDEIVRANCEKNKKCSECWDTIWVYSHTDGADKQLVAKMKAHIINGADGIVKAAGNARGYRMWISGFWWGSNSLVGSTGFHCLLAYELSDDKAAAAQYIETAEEYVHYLLGRNPLNMCFFTNMKQFGAENSAMIMFHGWLGNNAMANDPYGGKFIGEGPGKIGPPPGFVVGGPNGHIKKYVYGLHFSKKPWEYNEPCLGYQGPCASLMTYFAFKVK